MQFVRAIGRGFAWIATVLGLGSLAADMLKRWLEHNGYLDHPDQVIAQILSVATTLVEQRWFYPALTFVMGLAIGLSFDALARRISGEAESRRKILGYDMMKMADSLKERAGYWPMDFRDLRPSIDSLLIRSERERIYSPGE